LYHALEGQPPYGTNTNQLALLYTAASGQMSPPTQAGPMRPLLERLLRVDAAERPTMAEACETLAELALAMPVTALSSKHWQTSMLPAQAHPATIVAGDAIVGGRVKTNAAVA